MSSKTKVRSNKIKLKVLVGYMSLHRNFANGEYSGPMGSNQHLQQWEQLRSLLKEHGSDKTVEQWRHTWRDLKKKARDEGARFKKASTATGNIVQVPAVSENTEIFLSIIGEEMAYGIGSAQESGIGNFLTQSAAQMDNTAAMSHQPSTSTSFLIEELALPPPASNQLHTADLIEVLSPSRPAVNTQHASATPVSLPPPPPPSAPQRRVGLGDRAAEFLAAEQVTTGVLRDMLNTFQAQNELISKRNRILGLKTIMKKRQKLRQSRLEMAKKY